MPEAEKVLSTTGVIALVSVIVTAFYAFLTWRIARANWATVRAMERQTDALLRPHVNIVPFVPQGLPVIYLRINNSGQSAAEGLRLTIDRDFHPFGDRSQESLRVRPAFSESIEHFAPGAELIFELGVGHELFGQNADPAVSPTVFSIDATYSYLGKQVTERSHVDLRALLGSTPPPDAIVEKLEKIRKVIEDAVRRLK